jgi:hypothetical protein
MRTEVSATWMSSAMQHGRGAYNWGQSWSKSHVLTTNEPFTAAPFTAACKEDRLSVPAWSPPVHRLCRPGL